MSSFAPVTAHPALACAVLLTRSSLFTTWAALCILGAVCFIFRG